MNGGGKPWSSHALVLSLLALREACWVSLWKGALKIPASECWLSYIFCWIVTFKLQINAKSTLGWGLIEKQSTNKSAAYKLIFQLGVLTINPIACASRRLSYLIKKCRPDMRAGNPVPMAVLLLFVWQQFRIIGYIFKNKMTVHSGLVLSKSQCVCEIIIFSLWVFFFLPILTVVEKLIIQSFF